MGFRNGAWMSVFGVYPKTNGVTQIRGCTSRKRRDTGEYETDFSGFCSCIGNDVAQKALQLHPTEGHPVRIHLGDVEVKQTFEMVNGISQPKYTNYNIYSFDLGAEGNGGATPPPKSYTDQLEAAYDGIVDDADEEGLPF